MQTNADLLVQIINRIYAFRPDAAWDIIKDLSNKLPDDKKDPTILKNIEAERTSKSFTESHTIFNASKICNCCLPLDLFNTTADALEFGTTVTNICPEGNTNRSMMTYICLDIKPIALYVSPSLDLTDKEKK